MGTFDQRRPAGHPGVCNSSGSYVVEVRRQRYSAARIHEGLFGHGSKWSFWHGEVDAATIRCGAYAVHTRNKGILIVRAVMRAGSSTFCEIAKGCGRDSDEF